MHQSTGQTLAAVKQYHIKQRHEIAEWLGFETRNKYEILTLEGHSLGFAAEQGKGFIGHVLRHILGHWRSFEIHFYTPDRQEFMRAIHPFRWYFQELKVEDPTGAPIGRVVKQFSFITKRFQVRDQLDQVLFEVASPIWKIWSFPFRCQGALVAEVKKKWSGLLTEALTDKDTFMVEVHDPALGEKARQLILAASLYIDLIYFEKKASS